MIVEDLLVDEDLIHLENVLFDLDGYNFDSDILSKINELKLLVDKKLYSNFNPEALDIENQEMYIRFKLKK